MLGHYCTKNIWTNARFEQKLDVMMIHAIQSPEVTESYESFQLFFCCLFQPIVFWTVEVVFLESPKFM